MESGNIAGRGEGAVIEEVFVNTIGDQGLIVGIALAPHFGHHVERSVVTGRMAWRAEKSVRVLHEELEGHSQGDRTRAAELAFGIAAHPQEHEVGHVGDVEMAERV